MRVATEFDVEFAGLGEAIARELLSTTLVRPTLVRLTKTRLRVDGLALGIKHVSFTASIQYLPGAIRVHDFVLQGTLGLDGLALGPLHESLSRLDERWGPLHVQGEAHGTALRVSWMDPVPPAAAESAARSSRRRRARRPAAPRE